MHSDRVRQALLDIRGNVKLAQEFVSGYTLESFAADRRTFYAVTRCLEIVSETAHHVPETVRERHPDLPWRAIMDAGNVYRHGYDSVDEKIVWNTIQNSLTPLLMATEDELERIRLQE